MFPGTKHTYNFLLGNRALVDDVTFVLYASSGKIFLTNSPEWLIVLLPASSLR